MNGITFHSPTHKATVAPASSGGRHPSVARLFLPERECEWLEMERAYQLSGGLASTDELTIKLRARTDQPISLLARWIVSRDVVSLEWQSRTLLPVFQFYPSGMELRPCVVQVLRELDAVLSDWEVALWFARPNAWLGNAAPVTIIEVDARAVYDAARAERYVSQG